jgi:hypothetical protein
MPEGAEMVTQLRAWEDARMRRVAIIGAGIAGLVTAHGLRRAGHEVTLFSDRTAEQWLAGRPTGTACRFEPAIAYEAELGLGYWDAEAPPAGNAHLVYCPRPGNQLATSNGRQRGRGYAIDVRLQSHRWMHELEARGGRIVIESVTVERLDAIAAEHDLTIVAAGHGPLATLFGRDEARSVHHEPQRNVAMVVIKGAPLERPGMPHIAVKYHVIEGVGEAVWIPYFHRDAGPCWNLIFEAKIGGPMDIFMGAKTGAEAFAAARRVIETLTPWDRGWARDMELADELGWLVGRITPTVRHPVARLPSGRVVTCVGDTAIHFDPVAAQGANNCTKMAKYLVEQIVARGERPFDAAWMTETFDGFWHKLGQPAYALTNLFLAPMTSPGRLALIAGYGNDGVHVDGRQLLANRFSESFADPSVLVDVLTDMGKAKRLIEELTGHWWLRAVARGAVGVARGQLRQALGMSPNHPSSPRD